MGDYKKPGPVSKIALHVACNSLLNKDIGSKSDPCCVLLACDSQEIWNEVSFSAKTFYSVTL